VLDIVHGNPSTSTYRHVSSAAGRLSQRAVWRTVREKKLWAPKIRGSRTLPLDKAARIQLAFSSLNVKYSKFHTAEEIL
jgi:hypothetical protein